MQQHNELHVIPYGGMDGLGRENTDLAKVAGSSR